MFGREPHGRREFLEASAGVLICTLAGQQVFSGEEADLAKLTEGVEVPPKVAAAKSAQPDKRIAGEPGAGNTVEYWIKAEPTAWSIVPTGRDEMMNRKIRTRYKYTAWTYRPYSRNFGSPLAAGSIPGPLLEVEEGQTLVVNFRNQTSAPVTMHPHGIHYAEEMDGAYKGAFTDPGGFVQPGQEFQYRWFAQEGTAGAWTYHDHGPMDPIPLYKGLFGPLIIRPSGGTPPDQDFFLFFHELQPVATGLARVYSAVNGRAYAGNTPTLRASVGDEVAFHVYGMDDNFHTFHLHGHRWEDPGTGQIIDNKTFGPGDSYNFTFTEDNPGRWFYHCHVFSHLHMGMNGWYIVT